MYRFRPILLSFFTLLLVCSQALANEQQPVKILFHLNEPSKFMMLVHGVANARKVYGDRAMIEVVINGAAVTRLARFAHTSKQIDSMLDNGAEIGVCSNALLNQKVDPAQLDQRVTVIGKGGLSKIIRLQDEGYHYIKI